jgi:hypothetical protein
MNKYRDLLKKYMAHVDQEEGTTFVNCINDGWFSNVKITEEEKQVLLIIQEEVYKEYYSENEKK